MTRRMWTLMRKSGIVEVNDHKDEKEVDEMQTHNCGNHFNQD